MGEQNWGKDKKAVRVRIFARACDGITEYYLQRSLLKEIGFDETLKIAADYEHLLRSYLIKKFLVHKVIFPIVRLMVYLKSSFVFIN